MGKFANDADEDDDRTYDPSRFGGDEDGIEVLSNSRTEDKLTDAERADNAEHDRFKAELLTALREEESQPPAD